MVGYSGNDHHVRLHANQYGNDTVDVITNTLIKPRIEINSIGEETITSGGSSSAPSTTVTNGQILEELVHICDGGTVKGVSADYTWPQ